MKLCIDLCSGLGGFSQAFVDAGWEVIRVDNDPKFKDVPHTLIGDIRDTVWLKSLTEQRELILLLASPPCTFFSIAHGHFPRKGIKQALEIVGACFEAVAVLKPKWWLIENPRGYLRGIIGKPRQTIRYSDYDWNYPVQKPTDLWGNLPLPMVKMMRRPPSPSGANNLRDFFSSIPERSRIPLGVSKAVLEAVQ